MKLIPICGQKGIGRYALVDDEDYEILNTFKWHLDSKGYAHTGVYLGVWDGKTHQISFLIHRLVATLMLNRPISLQIDHIKGNLLDNRRSELRLATATENRRNRPKQQNNKSGYKGVYLPTDSPTWKAAIVVNYHRIHIGSFSDSVTAAHAYDKKAKELFGEFAVLNFP